jgi:hypothetical protein
MSESESPSIPVTMTERTEWAVVYRDGSSLREYPDPNEHHGFGEVDLENVARLEVGPNTWLGIEGPVFVVPIHPGDRPIFTRQNAIIIDESDQEQHVRYTVFGYQRAALDADGHNVQHLTYLPETNPDAPIVLSHCRLEIG